MFVNNQHGIQQRGPDVGKKFVFERVHSKEVVRRISWQKLDKSLVLISCPESCGTQALLTGGQKFEFSVSQGCVATCLRWSVWCCVGFLANFIHFPAVQTFWKSVKIWRRYKEFKGGNLFETQCSSALVRGSHGHCLWNLHKTYATHRRLKECHNVYIFLLPFFCYALAFLG